MFRRPRRPFQPMPARLPRQIAQEQMIRKAFEKHSSGDAQGMAETFAALAEQAEKEGRPRQAANLHAQAAHRLLDANDTEKAQLEADLAIAAFSGLGMEKRSQEFQVRFNTHKQNPGKPPAAETVHSPYDTVQPKTLPAMCPQCGAPVRSDEIEWIDPQSAECGYCGCVLKTL